MAKVRTPLEEARALSTAELDNACEASGLTQFELGALIGTDDRAVRRLLDPERKRADRLDLLSAIRAFGKERSSHEAIGEKPRALAVDVEPATSTSETHLREVTTGPSGPVLLRGGERVSRRPHKPKTAGATPARATSKRAA